MVPLREKLHGVYKNWETKDHKLLYLFLELTRRCNLQCRHCGSDCSSDSSFEEMPTETWLEIIDHIHSNFAAELAFVITGGEPLVRKDLTRIGTYISNLGHPWGIVSNGFALSETRIRELEKAGITSLTLSLDGGEESHNWLRGHPDSYRRIIAAIEALGKSNIPIKDAVTCVHPKNLGELDSIKEVLIEHGIKSWRLFRIFPIGRAEHHQELSLSREGSWEMLNWIERNRKEAKKRGLAINFSCEGYLPFRFDRKVRDEPYFCRAGINIASILADGRVTGCNNNGPVFYQGSIIERSFADIWENEFKKYRNRSWMKSGVCAECPSSSICRGGPIHLWDPEKNETRFCYLH
jgi:radical SAM protein with 4Fe4S-binding SPASM domain